jgi:hypothetical protein
MVCKLLRLSAMLTGERLLIDTYLFRFVVREC